MKIFLALFLALPVSLFSQGTIFSSITRTNVLTPTNLFLVSTPVAGGTRTIYLSDVKRAAGIGTEQSLGTIANGGTATLLLTTNVTSAIYSGATATIALPSISGATNAYVLYHAGTNTSGGSQVITFPALIRDETDSDTPITTITNNTGAAFRMAFTSVAGVWRNVDASGDALVFAAGSGGGAPTGTMIESGMAGIAGVVPMTGDDEGTNFVSSPITVTGDTNISVLGTIYADSIVVTNGGLGTPGGAALSIQYNSNGVFNGFGSWSNSLAVATIANLNVGTNLTVYGGTNGTTVYYDGVGSKYAELGAPPDVTTSGTYWLPIAPATGFVMASLSAVTNAQMSITLTPSANSYTVIGTTNQVIFGATNLPPASAVAPTKWISVQVTGEATIYRLPLYE